MREGWATSPLASLCTVFADGDWIESKDQSSSGMRLIQTGNVGEGEFKDRSEKARFISTKTFERLRCTEISEGDCLISRLPDPVGRACMLPNTGERMITAVDCTIVRFGKMLPKFFVYYAQSQQYLQDVGAQCTGTTRNRISRARLGEILIPSPSLEEQQRIVAILDEAFAGIASAKANAEKNLQNARELFDIHLQEVFSQRGEGWCEKSFADLCSIESNLVDPRQAEYMDLLHVGGGNIEAKTGDLIGLMSAKEEGLISGKFLFDEATVLYSKIRPYLMKVVRPNFSGLCSADIYPLTPNPERITRNFLFYLLLSPQFTEYAIAGSARAGMPKVNREHLFDYRPWVPIPSVQSALTSQLDAIAESVRALDGVYRRKLAALDELKQSLLAKAFAGELT